MYRENLIRVAKLCKDNGTNLIFLTISVPVEYNKIMMDVARENDIGYIDTEEILRNYYDKFLREGAQDYEG